MVKFSTRGDFKGVTKFLNNLNPHHIYNRLDKYGQMGVEALAAATPKKSGLTAASWYYEIDVGENSAAIKWNNSNKNEGVPIALMIQYGHGMPNGGFVRGVDYINPALEPIFEAIKDRLWKELGV